MANVKVAIRVRPLNSRERADGGRIAVEMEDKVVRVRNVKLDGRTDVRTEAPSDSRERLLEFAFDYCYWSVNSEATNYASQEEVFQDLGMCVLAGATEGYNVCLFAYGQTGSGKTYTMMGNPDSVGLTPRICQGLFQSGLDSSDGQTCRVEVSFLEIYNERVRDLLRGPDQKKPAALRVREHPEKGPYVQGLTQHVVEDPKQATDLLEEGIANRITAATHVHDASSRSHAIFSIQYTQAILENNLPSEIVSKINLVDLAGSERADPNYCRDRLTEGANINKSLVTLGIVISALAQNSQMCSSSHSINSMLSEGDASTVGSQSSSLSNSSRRHCFIPYRDSVLTWLLKDSLGGNSKTIMIATISPSCSSYNETLSTLRYAAHAKNIVNKPRVNEDASVRLIRELREEIDRLKSMLLSFSTRNPSPSLSDERDSSFSDIVLQNELKVEQLTKDWSEGWRDKRALLEQYSLDINQDRAGVQIQSLQPHLISMEPDVLCTGVTIYHLPEGITRIGPQDPDEEEPHIVVPDGSVCEIENQNGVVLLKPRVHTTCQVNNREVSEPCRLAQGAVITLGGCHKFRFNHPAEAAALRERRLIIDGCPLFSSSTPNSRAEAVGGQGASDGSAPWQRLEEHQRYVECLREEILVEQRRAEKDLEREQAHLRKQRSEIQQWILQEKQRLAAIRENGTLVSGVQTDVPSITAAIIENESSNETVPPSLIVGDRKRVVQEELLKHHALRRNENLIRRKRLRYQLERIARKRHLLEAKQELQRLETALLLRADGPQSPDLASSSKRRERPRVLRRHSFSVDLLSRLYPYHTPIFSQFLRRNRLSESTSSLSRGTFTGTWVSEECLPGQPRGRSNTMPSRCSQGPSSRTGSSENIKTLVKENVLTLSSPLQSSVWNHNVSVKTTMESHTRTSKKVLPIIKQSSKQKTSSKGGNSLPHEGNKGLESIRKALSRSVGSGIKTALARVFRKPPLGSRSGNSFKSASRSKAISAAGGRKLNAVDDVAAKQPHSLNNSSVSCDGLDQLKTFKERKQEIWNSAETPNKKTREWVTMPQDLTKWVENTGDKVAEDCSDCASLFSVDSLSSAYATALAEQLQQEECEPSEAESEDSQMSKDSLAKESSFHSLLNPPSTSRKIENVESKEMPHELFRTNGQRLTKQLVKESSHIKQQVSDFQSSSQGSVRETEAFLTFTDAWSSTDAADSPRIPGAPETLLKRCMLSETSSSQSQASIDLPGVATSSECQIAPCFSSTLGKDATVKQRGHTPSEREKVLDNFLSDLSNTPCSTPECTLLQEDNGPLSRSAEASITQNTVNNNTLGANDSFSSKLAPLETNEAEAFSGCFPGTPPDKHFTVETKPIPSGDESVLTDNFIYNFIDAKCDGETEELQSEKVVNSSNLLRSISPNVTVRNETCFEPQNIMEVSNEKTSVQHRVECTERCSESRDGQNTKDNPLKINLTPACASKASDSARPCDAQLENESCNVYSRKRSKGSREDLAGNLKNPKRSCVESLVPADSVVTSAESVFNNTADISRRNSTDQLLQAENDITASMSKTSQPDSVAPSMDSHINMYQNNHLSTSSGDKPAPPATKTQRVPIGCPVDAQFPDVKLVDKEVFDSSLLQKIGLAINSKISEVVKEHLNMSLQVDGGEDMNEKPEKGKTFLATNVNAFKETAVGSLGSLHVSSCVTEYSVDDRVNVENTDECVRDKRPTEKDNVLEHQGAEFLGSCLALSVKSFREGNYKAYGPQGLRINPPEANTVPYEGPTDTGPESSVTRRSNELKSESSITIQPNPEVIPSSRSITVPEEHEQDVLMKTDSRLINEMIPDSTPAGPAVRNEDHRGQKPEENNISGHSNNVSELDCCSELMAHVVADIATNAVKTDEASRVNKAATFQQVLELNALAHVDPESESEHSLHSDRAEHVHSRLLKNLAHHECPGERRGGNAQKQLHNGHNMGRLNEAQNKSIDPESRNCSRKLHEETTISKPCQELALGTAELQTDTQTQIIQSVRMNKSPSKCFQKEDHSLCKNDHTQHRRKIPEFLNNTDITDSDQLQPQDLSKFQKSDKRPEQGDITEPNKPTMGSVSSSLNLEQHQVYIKSTDNSTERKQDTTRNASRLVFSRTNEERHRVKPKRYRKAHFTAPPSSSTDSTPDSSLYDIAKSKLLKCGSAIPAKAGTAALKQATTGNRNSSADESSRSLSLERSKGSLESNPKHIDDGTTDESEEVRQKHYRCAPQSDSPGLSKDDGTAQLSRSNSTQSLSHGNSHEGANCVTDDSVHHREPILHFGSSDINPFVHRRKKDGLLNAASKSQAFGSAVNISSHLPSLESSSNGIARCCSMDIGLNVQNSPFSSHLSTYAVQRGLSSTLSSADDSKEHISADTKLAEAPHTAGVCSDKIAASGSDSCNNTLDLASTSSQVDEIVLVYSSEHESRQCSRKCDHGTQTVTLPEDLERKNRHKRSSTEVSASRLTDGTSTTRTSLQNMSEYLSELIVSTSDLLGDIQCMRTGEKSPLKTRSNVSAVKIHSDKHCKSDGATQTAIDVGIQTEDSASQMKRSNVVQSASPVQIPQSHEVNVIVKVIGSEVCKLARQDDVMETVRAQDEHREHRRTFEAIKSMPELRSERLPRSEKFGGKLDTVKILSLENVAANQHCFRPDTVEPQAYNQQIKLKNKPDRSVSLIDRASSPILTVVVAQKNKTDSNTSCRAAAMLSKPVGNPLKNKPVDSTKPKSQRQRDDFFTHQTENKPVSSISLEDLSNHRCVNVCALDACATDHSFGRYVQNVRAKPSNAHSHSYSARHWQPVDTSQNTLQSSTPVNHSQRRSMQEYKHRLYKDMSRLSDLSKDPPRYQEEDGVSLTPSDCNTDVLVSINPLAKLSPSQDDYGLPENLPMHNKFTNWSGISQQPATRLTVENYTTMEKSPEVNTLLNPRSAEPESLGYRCKPGLSESADRRTREIERLRREREQVLASMQLDLSLHPPSIELTEAKMHYGLGKTDTLLKMLTASGRTESTICTKQQLYDRHKSSIDGLRKEREDRLQTSRRARSLSPGKHANSTKLTSEASQRAVDPAGPSRQREYLRQLRKEVVEMSRVPAPPKRAAEYPTDIELLLRDYSRAREEAKTEIARARARLRERTEQEKRRLTQQAPSQSAKDRLRLCTRVSNSTLCTGSNPSLSSGPTSGYNSSFAALLKDGTSPAVQITGVSDKELKVKSRPPIIPLQSLKVPRAWLSAQDIRVDSSSSVSSPPGRQRTGSFSSPSSVSIPYLDIADCTLTSAISEIHAASGGDLKKLVAGNAQAGWRYQGLENGVQTFHRPSIRPSAHGFLGAMELQRPLSSVWSLIRDHTKAHLYNKSLKSAWTRSLDDTTQLVYLLTDPSSCHMKQPRDFCCLTTECKQDDMWVLAMQSVFEESLPRPSVDTVRGEMFPSAWVLQLSQRQGREVLTVIYLLQVDLGTPTMPQRLVNDVARKQAAVIADLDSFLSL